MYGMLTFAVLGGDARQLSLCRVFAEAGHTVRAYGLPAALLPPKVHACETWREAVDGADAAVLPLPVSPDGIRIRMPLAEDREPPAFLDLLAALPPACRLYGGKFGAVLRAEAASCGREICDYYECESFAQRNALPTAEGAVAILMREVPRTVHGLPVAVTGYGRVARALTALLDAMGARVTVAARRPSDLEEAAERGFRTVRLTGEDSAAAALCAGQAAVFNTVPHRLFTAPVLAAMSRETLLVDLASAPGGVDANAADACGIRVIWALSLPGKYAPVTAGEIIADLVLSDMGRGGTVKEGRA